MQTALMTIFQFTPEEVMEIRVVFWIVLVIHREKLLLPGFSFVFGLLYKQMNHNQEAF